jgi:hypothetical protein
MLVRFWGTRGSHSGRPDRCRVRSKKRRSTANGRRFDDDGASSASLMRNSIFLSDTATVANSACGHRGRQEYMGGYGLGAAQSRATDHARARSRETQVYNFFMSHVHWGSHHGVPLFPPAYIPGNTILHPGVTSLAVCRRLSIDSSQIPASQWRKSLGANYSGPPGAEQCYEINGFRVKAKLQPHHGDSYGYRFEKDARSSSIRLMVNISWNRQRPPTP